MKSSTLIPSQNREREISKARFALIQSLSTFTVSYMIIYTHKTMNFFDFHYLNKRTTLCAYA